MRTRTSFPSGHGCSASARCASAAAAAALPADAKAAKLASPSLPTWNPPWRSNASPRRRRCCDRRSWYASPVRWSSCVEPSMSLKSSVTVPLGSSAMWPVSRSKLRPRNALEPVASLANRAQPDEAWIAREAPWPLPPVTKVCLQHPGEQRVATPERVVPGLAVPAPELGAVEDAVPRTPPEPPELQPKPEVEPDDRVRLPEHEVSELSLVV